MSDACEGGLMRRVELVRVAIVVGLLFVGANAGLTQPVPVEPSPVQERVGEGSIPAPALKVSTVDGEIEATLVGPDVTRVGAGDEHDGEPFADVVLVGGAKGFWCTGVLIDARHVLTAAHCLPATRVGFGNTVASSIDSAIARSSKHPSSDVALLKLSASAKVPTHVRRANGAGSPPLGVVRIIGFGVKDQLRMTGFGVKRQLDVPIDGWGCDARRSRELTCNPSSEFTLRGGRGNDTCFGDSGGPVFERVVGGWQLLGITSRGTRPKRILCGEGGIYSRVDAIADWLQEELNQ